MCESIKPGITVLPVASIFLTPSSLAIISASFPVAKILLFSINNDSFLGFLPVPSIIVPFSIRVFSSIFLTSRALYYQF